MAIRRFLDSHVLYAPDERSGGGGGGEMVDVIVNGEVVARVLADEVGQLGNLGDWRKKLTHEADEVASIRRQNMAGSEALAADRATLARERAAAMDEPVKRLEQKIETVEQAGIDTSDWPNPVDDPEGFKQAMAKGLKQAADLGYKTAMRASKDVEARQKTAETAAQVSVASTRVFQQNQRTVDAYIDRMKAEGTPLTGEQTRDLISHMDTSLRLPKEGFATRDTASGKIAFTEAAVEAADHVVRFKYYQSRAEEKGVKDTLRRHGVPESREVTQAPSKTASPKEKADFALTLGPKQQETYVNSLPDAELNEIMLHIYQEAGADGATSLMRAGVQE